MRSLGHFHMTVPSKNLFQSLPSVPKKSIQNTATGEGYRAIRIQRKFQVTKEGERGREHAQVDRNKEWHTSQKQGPRGHLEMQRKASGIRRHLQTSNTWGKKGIQVTEPQLSPSRSYKEPNQVAVQNTAATSYTQTQGQPGYHSPPTRKGIMINRTAP